jgi:Tol biopolymer transport system component
VWIRKLKGDTTTRPLLNGLSPRVSPNGQWIAFTSPESGANEVYVAAFPSMSRRQQISIGGGLDPVWSADGQTLFYIHDDAINSAKVVLGDEPRVTSRARLVGGGVLELNAGHASFDVAPNGKDFIVIRISDDIQTIVAHDWWREAFSGSQPKRGIPP